MHFRQVKRRAFITLLGGAAAWPLVGRAQQQPDRMRRVGALFATSPDPNSALLPALRQYLGPDLMIEARWARNDPEQLLTLAEELVGLGPDVIVTSNTAATMAARRATSNIPLVCAACTDPVGMDLATNEARPGTNVTGILTRVEGLTGKQLELASEVLPRMITVGVTRYDFSSEGGEPVEGDLAAYLAEHVTGARECRESADIP
jgi:putative ABC transport system substrate-binding protein